MGKSRTTPQSFTLDGHADMQVELDKGAWDFYAIGWEGNPAFVNKSFTGQIRCAYKAKVLEASEEEIGFNLSSSNCLNKIPPPNDFYPNAPSLLVSNNIPELTISTCIDASSTTVPATYDNSCDYPSGANAGLGKSFKIKKYYSIGSENGPQQPAGTDESDCFAKDTNTTMRLPLGDPTAQDGLPSWEIISYTEAGCGGDFIKYRFEKGLVNGPEHPDQKSAVRISGSGAAYLLLEHNPLTVSDNGPQANHFFGNGSNGAGYEASFSSSNNEERIIGINSQGDTLTVPSGQANIFYAGDEIMWYVNDCFGTGCSSGFLPGRYGYGHVKSRDVTNNTITLFKSIHLETQYGQLTLPTNTTLGAAIPNPSTSGNWLSMQVIKVHNFINFNLFGTANVPQYSESFGKGGILVMKVKNNFSVDATGGARKMFADGKGRLRNHSINYSHCTGQPCLRLGAGDGTSRGGGIMIITAKNLLYTTDGTNVLSFSANATAGSPTDGGIIMARFGTLVYDPMPAPSNTGFSANIGGSQFEANGSSDGSGNGAGGYARFEYCNEESPNGTTGSPPTSNTGSGANGTVDVIEDPSWCQ